ILESLHGDGRGYRESSIVPSVVSDYRGGGCTREALLLSTRSDHSLSERSEEHTSELQSLMRISYAVFCLKKKKHTNTPSIQLYPQSNKRKHRKHNIHVN